MSQVTESCELLNSLATKKKTLGRKSTVVLSPEMAIHRLEATHGEARIIAVPKFGEHSVLQFRQLFNSDEKHPTGTS